MTRSGVALTGIATVYVLAGCAVQPGTGPTNQVTDAMRTACPTLTDDLIAGWIFAIREFKEDGTTEEDALQLFTDGCDSIPPDGNFQGDVEGCRDCLTVIVQEVYAADAKAAPADRG